MPRRRNDSDDGWPDDFIGSVNLGNPDEFTILELAERIIDITGSKSKVVFKPLPSDDPKQRQPDIATPYLLTSFCPI